MRILNIMLARVRGGVETMGLRYHEALHAEGYEVLSLGHPQGMLAEVLPAGQFQPLTASSSCDPLAAAALWRHSMAFEPDLVLTHGNRATGLNLLPFMPARHRTVQVMHNQSFRPHLKRVKAALCVSRCVREAMNAAYPSVKTVETANFSHLAVGPVKSAPVKRPVFGALGRLHTVKGFDVLIQAAARLRDAGLDFELRIAGDGPERAALGQRVESLNLRDRVTFSGWQAKPEDFLSDLDLFVLPSRCEAFGLVAIEAMAAGVPVVATQSEGPRQVLMNGRFGTLCAGGDPAALAEAMTTVTSNWEHALDMAAQAQVYAVKTYGFGAGRFRLRTAIESLDSRTLVGPSVYTGAIPRGAPPAYVPLPSRPERQ